MASSPLGQVLAQLLSQWLRCFVSDLGRDGLRVLAREKARAFHVLLLLCVALQLALLGGAALLAGLWLIVEPSQRPMLLTAVGVLAWFVAALLLLMARQQVRPDPT